MVADCVGSAPVYGGRTIEALNRGSTRFPKLFFWASQLSQEQQGAATITGTVLGVILLGSIGSALTFLGVSPYWEKAIQGSIILGAITINSLGTYREKNASHTHALQG